MKLIKKGTEAEVLIEGRLDTNTSPEAERILRDQIAKYDKITLNLARLDYVSSAGLRVIKVMHVAMKKKDGKLVLKNTGRKVMEVLEMSGFAGMLNFE